MTPRRRSRRRRAQAVASRSTRWSTRRVEFLTDYQNAAYARALPRRWSSKVRAAESREGARQ